MVALILCTGDLRAQPAGPTRPALDFEPNVGQFDPRVRFASRTREYTLFLTDDEAVVSLHGTVLRLSFSAARPRVPNGQNPLPGTVNYLRGNDPAAWRTGIATYGRVTYEAIYPGIDLTYYGNQSSHEYDLVVAPGANPDAIAMRITGAERIDLDGGDLRLATAAGTFTMRAPNVYQTVNGVRHHVNARYAVDGYGAVAFDLGPYDAREALVIDPELVYGTFLGGTGNGVDAATAVALDSSGAPYVVGTTETTDFPTENAIQSQRRGQSDAVVVKLSPDGLQRVYATYLGGGSFDGGADIAVRADGVAYVVGSTSSDDFPVRQAYQAQRRGQSDAFIVELSRDGRSIVRGTYLGGGDVDDARGVELARFRDERPPNDGQPPINAFGDYVFVYGATKSPDFPTINPAQGRRIGERDGFVTVLERDSLQPGYSTYIGREGDNSPESLILKRGRGEFYMFLRRSNEGTSVEPVFARFTRQSPSSSLAPQDIADIWGAAIFLVQGALEDRAEEARTAEQQVKAARPAPCEEHDVFSERDGWFCAPDPLPTLPRANRSAVTADQLSRTALVMSMPGCLPVPPARTCNERAVLVFYDADVKIISHLNFGGTRRGREFIPTQIAVDKDRRYHIIGHTSDNALPVVNPVQSGYRGSSEGFILTLDPSSGDTSFFSYLGGTTFDTLVDIAIDKDGHRWIVGSTQSSDFPTTRSGVQPELRGRIDAFVVKITP